MNIKEKKKNIIQAGYKAVDELIKVAKEKIVDSEDDVSADRLKNAAATKKLAIFDAFEILNRIEEEKNSRGYINETTYAVANDQVFLYKRNKKWIPPLGYCFVKPIISNNILLNEKEIPLRGIIKYVDKNLKDIYKEDLVGFTPSSEYEFIIDGERMYRVPTNSISIKYERQGNEKEYNPSWA